MTDSAAQPETARNTDVNISSLEASETVATDFFWNAVIKFLPAPSEMLKSEGTTGCIAVHPKSMDKGQLSTAAFVNDFRKSIPNTSLIFVRLMEQGKEQ